jgi:hypothetical protein
VNEPEAHCTFAPSRLIRTEITTIVGLMVKAEIDWPIPESSTAEDTRPEERQKFPRGQVLNPAEPGAAVG